jgi:hypothetical protein
MRDVAIGTPDMLRNARAATVISRPGREGRGCGFKGFRVLVTFTAQLASRKVHAVPEMAWLGSCSAPDRTSSNSQGLNQAAGRQLNHGRARIRGGI